MTYGNEIRNRRRAQQVSQAEIAVEIDMSQVYVSSIERGILKCNDERGKLILQAIARIIGRRQFVEKAKERAIADFRNQKAEPEVGR